MKFESWGSALRVIALIVVFLWSVEVIDSFLLSDNLQKNGIQPRSLKGLDGILWHPFLHAGFSHIASNTLPFIVLGAFVALRGFNYWLKVSLSAIFIGGFLTWLFAEGGNHIGASGVVFAYFGAILGAALFERRPANLAVGMVVILLYSSLLVGLVPQPLISWEGHLFGFITGVGLSRLNKRPKPVIAGPMFSGEEWRLPSEGELE